VEAKSTSDILSVFLYLELWMHGAHFRACRAVYSDWQPGKSLLLCYSVLFL